MNLQETFLEQLNSHLGIAHKISRVYCKNADDRSDVFQEMMYQLWRSWPSFDNRSKFSTWMFRVCLNTALTFRRRSKPGVTESLEDRHDKIASTTSANREESAMLLSDAIATLSDVNKAIILLYLENLRYEEIANITGLTKANVGVRLVRIKKELEAKLKDKINDIEL
jgi:RNA polymerase sigma factor (sigma-70 family)